MDLVDSDAVCAAAARLEGRTLRTPLLPCARLSAELDATVLLKAENLQHTGSFKVRGALNAVLASAENGTLPTGVASFSAGNHGAAISYAARAVGIPAVVCMPHGAVAAKVEAVHRYGGEIVHTDDLVGMCAAVADERSFAVVHPFDDPQVIAGQGTVGAEILAQCPQPDLVVVPVGGGGLISGIAAVLRGDPAAARARLVGVEPVQAEAMSHALRTGAPERLPTPPSSMADGLAPPFVSARTLAHVQAFVDDVLTVDEAAIADAWWAMLDATKLFVEPSAAVGLAAIRNGLIPVRPGSTVVLVLSGGNAGRTNLAGLASSPSPI